MKKLATFLVLNTALVLPIMAAPLAQWSFNSDDGLVSTGSLTPTIGSGSLALIGGATSFFTSGSPNDPATFPLDSSLSVGNYPAQGVGSGTTGLEGWVSTLGYADVMLSFDFKTQPSGNKWFALQASDNSGSSWLDVAVFGVSAADTWFTKTFNVSSLLPSVNNNLGFGFRLVAAFKPGTNFYEASEAGYNGDFGLQSDQLSVQATVVPEPTSLWMLVGGLLTCGLALTKRRA
ncbi:PEP-CTERM sorting domain-containing protein [Aquabacterium sp.]|uniref:PEP-CTERM sorting domain-containing protein n=1 Tax=Aquabacterium sp. TaxID=1872578 RepID=UPI002489F404|nr:PEP-CTERM sorting domain-containing protein [Aquabacterium sp.]MDI1260221.1 PEP-CTERM sorting domain-containing protein [Aquabacterium sp.]